MILHAPCREADDYLQDMKQQRSGPFAIYGFNSDLQLYQNWAILHGSIRCKLKEYPITEDSILSCPLLSCPFALKLARHKPAAALELYGCDGVVVCPSKYASAL